MSRRPDARQEQNDISYFAARWKIIFSRLATGTGVHNGCAEGRRKMPQDHIKWEDGSNFPITSALVHADESIIIQCYDPKAPAYGYKILIRKDGTGGFYGDKGDSKGEVSAVKCSRSPHRIELNGTWIEASATPLDVQEFSVVLEKWEEPDRQP